MTTFLPTIESVDYKIAGDLITVTPVFTGVDCPRFQSILVPFKNIKLAQRLRYAMLTGAVYTIRGISINEEGKTYPDLEPNIQFRIADAELKRLGY